MSRRKGKTMMYMTVTKRDPEIDMFLDMREEERLQEEECMACDLLREDWEFRSSEALVDEMDHLMDLQDDLDYDLVYDLD